VYTLLQDLMLFMVIPLENFIMSASGRGISAKCLFSRSFARYLAEVKRLLYGNPLSTTLVWFG